MFFESRKFLGNESYLIFVVCSSNLKPGKNGFCSVIFRGRKLSHVCLVDALGYCHFTHMMQSFCWVKG